MIDYYDRSGKPIKFPEFIRLFEDPNYQVLKQDQVGSLLVSTIWLGLDHGFGSDKPVIFETMVFDTSNKPDLGEGRKGVGKEVVTRRYSTEQEALEGHHAMVAFITDPLSEERHATAQDRTDGPLPDH